MCSPVYAHNLVPIGALFGGSVGALFGGSVGALVGGSVGALVGGLVRALVDVPVGAPEDVPDGGHLDGTLPKELPPKFQDWWSWDTDLPYSCFLIGGIVVGRFSETRLKSVLGPGGMVIDIIKDRFAVYFYYFIENGFVYFRINPKSYTKNWLQDLEECANAIAKSALNVKMIAGVEVSKEEFDRYHASILKLKDVPEPPRAEVSKEEQAKLKPLAEYSDAALSAVRATIWEGSGESGVDSD